jgi:hypothetical protein
MSDDPKLRELRPEFRIRINGILDALEAQGYHPKISNAHRTWEQQAEKVAKGYAPAGCLDPGSHNWGLACDIIDHRMGWTVSLDNARFFALLCDLAHADGLVCGGSWDRHGKRHKSIWNQWGLGYDVAHVEAYHVSDDDKKEYLGE